jgi:hypothetical protein
VNFSVTLTVGLREEFFFFNFNKKIFIEGKGRKRGRTKGRKEAGKQAKKK